MRINLGIRRRLCPLLGNNRRAIELINGLLFSLPGTPVIYYGDEIGMGDNIYLGDRDGVRTPMQWSGDRNAGFSSANPQRLILPVVIDYEYHYQTVNVEAQEANRHSLLWWMRRLIALRNQYKAFGRGTMEFLSPENPRVIAYIRSFENERILVVANLSRFVQYVELIFRASKGCAPIELFGHSPFPPIGDLPYLHDPRTAWLRVVLHRATAHRRGRRSLGLRHAANSAYLGDRWVDASSNPPGAATDSSRISAAMPLVQEQGTHHQERRYREPGSALRRRERASDRIRKC